jgi:hypothetical protein
MDSSVQTMVAGGVTIPIPVLYVSEVMLIIEPKEEVLPQWVPVTVLKLVISTIYTPLIWIVKVWFK